MTCAECGSPKCGHDEFPLEATVAVGFGSSGLYRDGVCVIDGEERALVEDRPLIGAECEFIAAADPHHKWEIVMYGPLSGSTYERNADGRWVCTERNEGFA